MIRGCRTSSTSQSCTKILLSGYEISIAFDDSHLGGDLFRGTMRVFKDDDDVTNTFMGVEVTEEGIRHPTAEDLLSIMKQIKERA